MLLCAEDRLFVNKKSNFVHELYYILDDVGLFILFV